MSPAPRPAAAAARPGIRQQDAGDGGRESSATARDAETAESAGHRLVLGGWRSTMGLRRKRGQATRRRAIATSATPRPGVVAIVRRKPLGVMRRSASSRSSVQGVADRRWARTAAKSASATSCQDGCASQRVTQRRRPAASGERARASATGSTPGRRRRGSSHAGAARHRRRHCADADELAPVERQLTARRLGEAGRRRSAARSRDAGAADGDANAERVEGAAEEQR